MSRNSIGFILMVVLTAALIGCGGKKITVEIPPQVDLKTLGTIGIIPFDVQSDGQLPVDITLKFIQFLQSAQPGVPILELDNHDDVLREVGFASLDTEAVKAIGNKYGIESLFTGSLVVTHSIPDVKFGKDLNSMSAASYVRGTLDARLLQTSAGATIWSNGAHGKWKLAGLNLASGGLTSIGMNNVEDTYNKMLQELARVGTLDFRKSYETRRIRE